MIFSPIKGLMWIGQQLLERANAEFDETENLNKQLLNLQLAFDLGEVSEEEFEEREEELLLKIQEHEELAKAELEELELN